MTVPSSPPRSSFSSSHPPPEPHAQQHHDPALPALSSQPTHHPEPHSQAPTTAAGQHHSSSLSVSDVHLPNLSASGSTSPVSAWDPSHSERPSTTGDHGSHGKPAPHHPIDGASASGRLDKLRDSSSKGHHDTDSRPRTASAEHEARRLTGALKMTATSLHSSTRSLLGDAFRSFTTGIAHDASAHDKITAVLVKARESGMTLERIYTFFTNSKDNAHPHAHPQHEVSVSDFARGIQQLNSDTFMLTDSEVAALADHFDQDHDGKVSLAEFEQFCLSIPHVSWRAEKMRADRSGSHSSLEVEARRSLDNLNRSSSRGSRDQMHHAPQPPHQLPHLERSGSSSPLPPLSPGPPSEEFKLVTESSKLMWRLRETLMARFFAYEGASCKAGVMAVVLHNETLTENYPTLYIDLGKVSIADKAVQLLLADKLEKYRHSGKPELSEESKEKLSKFVRQELAAQYVAARISLEQEADEAGQHQRRKVVLLKLAGDEWDSLLTEKPADVAPPPLLEVRRRTTFEDFQRTSQDLEKMLQQDAAKLGPLDAVLDHHISAGSTWRHGHLHDLPPAEPSIPEDKEDA